MGDESGGGDSMDIISSLPDDILHHILSFLPTYPAITTCVLSRRWRHIWRGTPCLSLDCEEETAESVQKTLQYHTAPKLSSLHLGFRFDTEFVEFPEPITHHQFFIVDPWVEFAHSHHTQNLSFDFRLANYVNYKFPDIFYVNSYVKRLTLAFHGFTTLLPGSPVFWPSLTNLSLERCRITDESAANILSGCPLLQSLTLVFCRMLRRLDLTKSTRLTRLDLVIGIMNTGPTGPTAIIAPHIQFFSFQNSETPFTLDHLSSLTQAKLNLFQYLTPDFSQDFVLEMLAKLHNIDMLTLGSIFLQTSSLAELRGLPFPILKITALTLETEIFRYVVPGIARLLQNSPGLKKLTLRLLKCYTVEEKYLDSYADSRGVEFGILPTSSEPKLIASFIEFLLGNTKTLETLVVRLEDNLDPTRFEELLEMVPTLSQNHNVSIVLRPGPLFPDVHRKDKYVSPFS